MFTTSHKIFNFRPIKFLRCSLPKCEHKKAICNLKILSATIYLLIPPYRYSQILFRTKNKFLKHLSYKIFSKEINFFRIDSVLWIRDESLSHEKLYSKIPVFFEYFHKVWMNNIGVYSMFKHHKSTSTNLNYIVQVIRLFL